MPRAATFHEVSKVVDRGVVLGKELDHRRVRLEEDEICFSSAVGMKDEFALVDEVRLLEEILPFVKIHLDCVVGVSLDQELVHLFQIENRSRPNSLIQTNQIWRLLHGLSKNRFPHGVRGLEIEVPGEIGKVEAHRLIAE